MKAAAAIVVLVFSLTGIAHSDEGKIAERFHGNWTLIARIDSEGDRHKPEKDLRLVLTKGALALFDNAGREVPQKPSATVSIDADGEITSIFKDSITDSLEKVSLGRATIESGELHIKGVHFGGRYHSVFSLVPPKQPVEQKTRPAEQDGAGQAPTRPESK